jgi:hypothetical protein
MEGGQEVQEKSVLEVCRIYLFRRIVGAMVCVLGVWRVSRERRWRDVGRQLQGGEGWLGEMGEELLDAIMVGSRGYKIAAAAMNRTQIAA